MNKYQLVKIREFTKPFYEKAGGYHGWDHIVAVRRNALRLAKHYKNVNLVVLEAACYLHDIGRSVGRSVKDKGHNQESVKLATPFLEKIGVSKKDIGAVNHAVECHAKELILSAKTMEAKLLFDADKLEILSVYGFMRVWMFLVEERKMKLDEALDFLWDWVVEVRKRYLQTIYAKRIVDPELKVLTLMVKRFRAWKVQE